MQISRARSAHSAASKNTKAHRALASAIESMESRVMMSVSLDSAGWTKITPSSDSRQVYVSSSSGSDSNSGLSTDAPVKTIGRGVSLLRNGSPDWLELKRGDVFNEAFPDWTKSGRSADEPMVVTSYGDPSAARPWLKTGAKRGFFSQATIHDLAMIGLKFSANTRDPDSSDFTGTAGGYGFQTVGPDSNLLVEDTSFDHYVYDVSMQGFTGYAKNIKFRRDQILDTYTIDPGDGSMIKSVGFYASMTDGLLLEGNVFDHNGWNEKINGANATIWSHDIYLWESNKNSVIRDNIIADAGSHGLQARGGGDIEGNLFLKNPIDALLGNGSTITTGGVTGKITDNVFTEDRDTNGMKRGWAIEVGNIKSAEVSDNIITGDTQNAYPAIQLQTDTTADNAKDGVGINNLTVDGNIVSGWYEGLSIATGFKFGGSGYTGLNNLTVTDNDFQNTTQQKIINQPQAFNSAEEDWSDNRYNNAHSSAGWFSLGGAMTSLSTWQSKVESSAQNQKMNYPDPTRTVAKYNATVGGANSEAAFLSSVRNNNKANWDTDYTASSVNGYIQAGFTGSTPTSTGGGGTGGSTGGGTTGGTDGSTGGSISNSDTNPPSVLWSHFDPATQTVSVKFDEDVSKSLNLSDLRMKNTATMALIPYDQMTMSYDKSTNTATWTFTKPIAAADYKIIVSASGINDAAGNHLDGNNDGAGGDDHFIYVHASDLLASQSLASLNG